MLPPGLMVNFRISKFGAPSFRSSSQAISVLTAFPTFCGFTVPAALIAMERCHFFVTR
jgi:hypothetical protein